MAFWLSVPQLGVRALGGVFTEECYEISPRNMGFLPSRLCRAAGENPRPAIDSKGVSG